MAVETRKRVGRRMEHKAKVTPTNVKSESPKTSFFEPRFSATSGRFRNLENGVQPLARKALPKIWGLPRPLLVT